MQALKEKIQIEGSKLIGYAIAVTFSLLALLISLVLSLLPTQSPLILFVMAVTVSSCYGNRSAGLLATGLCSLACNYFFLAPIYSPAVATTDGVLELGFLVGVSLLINVFSAVRHVTESPQHKHTELQRLETLQQLERAILNAESTQEIAREALLRMHYMLPYVEATVTSFDFETGNAQILAGTIDGVSKGETVPLEQLIPTMVPRESGGIRCVEDIAALKERPLLIGRQLQEGKLCFLAVPLVVEKDLIGELSLYGDRHAAFSLEHQQIAIEVANLLAVAIQQARQREQLQNYAVELEHRVAERTAALEESNADMEAFTYSVAHDLREPVRVLQGFAKILLEDYADHLDSVARDFIERILTNAERMETLLKDLLTYSRLNRLELSVSPVSLSNVMAEVLTLLEVQIQEQQAIVTVEEPLLTVMGNSTILVQAIANLLSNAIKFVSPEVQPSVRVWTQKRDLWVRLWVEDNGIGVEARHQQRIFKVFERLHAEEVYPGTGIGLAIVRRGVERIGGKVGVESAIGQGSRLWIELPADPES
ncbi:ATP-binding protein [Scytonema sp. NUACC26]|uniref:ATP-binding protein n=1 Tax=Scytonema sp. NUACC26 TaxID=3140176 RepID=UPI0034DC43A0